MCLRASIWLFLIMVAARLPAQRLATGQSGNYLDLQTGTTESELVTRALAQNPTLAAARQEIEIARGGLTQARLRKNPSLMIGGLKEVDGQDNRFSIGGAVPLELFKRREIRTELAGRKLEATRESVNDRERILAGEVRMRFGETLAAVRNLMFAEQLFQSNRDALKLLEARVREGAAGSLDADEARVEVSRIDALRVEDRAKAEIDLLKLKEAVGMQPEEPLRLKGSLEEPGVSVDPGKLLQIALAQRPDLAAQRATGSVMVSDLRLRQAEAKPDATVSASYERPDTGFGQRAFDASGNIRPIRQTFNYAVVGIDIALPAFNRNQGAIEAGRAELAAARSRIAAADLAVRSEVAQNYVRYAGAQSRIAVYRTGVREQAARNLEVVRQVYGYGRITLLEVISEQRRYIDIETGYTDVLYEGYAARVALEQAAGASLR